MAEPSTNDGPKTLIVGWIGLGSMGNAMAQRIQRQLTAQKSPEPLRYWNRTISRGQALKELNGKACGSIEQLVSESDVVFISVSFLYI